MSDSEKRTISINQGHCKFFVKRKKRYCRMKVKQSELYCCEHQIEHTHGEKNNFNIRIPCPLDSKHSCYQNKLQKHLRICNARPKTFQSFILKGVNSGYSPNDIRQENVSISLSDQSVADVMNVIDRVKSIYNGKHIEPTEKICTHPIVEDEMKSPIYGDKTKKHLKQISSVLGLLSEYNLLKKILVLLKLGLDEVH
ncbi:hypothetical protein WA026_023426 [Henosepilachna vigintioctopunctata]|uniref:tRNA:m(4)X modification enzyme TRM13 n=1 Tax=Henosepilachna vigintioctopunctata TaxID=420089 RepID=A0AAW1TQ26_9CUCU